MRIIDASKAKPHGGATPDPAPQDAPLTLEAVILDLCAAQKPGKSIDPMLAATTFTERRGDEPIAWRKHLTEVRRVAVKLALAGRLVILRKGKPVDPLDFRGVFRLALPSGD